jgi:isocitrate dehydrogenase
MTHKITLIEGDGIGPEVAQATRRIIDASGVKIDWEICHAGLEIFKKGLSTGVPQETIDSISRNKVALKGPLETPVGFGEKSANVTLRKMFETYGNIRPVKEIPAIPSPYQGRKIDLVIVRENVEDLYAGIEHMQTPGVAQCLKVISRKGCEKIVRLAFEFAKSQGRKKVTCATKANIMKLTEGLLKRTFEEVATEYPEIESQHMIVDNCAHQLVLRPESFDVIVMTNMNGDILSDLASALMGGLGFAPSSNIGNDVSMFEAVHGSAPKYAGLNVANPTAMLLSSVMMLRHIGEFDAADLIEQSLYYTMAVSRVLTRDALGSDTQGASTTEFTDAIIKNFGNKYDGFVHRDYKPIKLPVVDGHPDLVHPSKSLVQGFDIFVETIDDVKNIGQKMDSLCANKEYSLKFISCRGVVVYPHAMTMPDMVDQVRCRVVFKDLQSEGTAQEKILPLLGEMIKAGLKWGHMEKLNNYDGEAAYTKAHGE